MLGWPNRTPSHLSVLKVVFQACAELCVLWVFRIVIRVRQFFTMQSAYKNHIPSVIVIEIYGLANGVTQVGTKLIDQQFGTQPASNDMSPSG